MKRWIKIRWAFLGIAIFFALIFLTTWILSLCGIHLLVPPGLSLATVFGAPFFALLFFAFGRLVRVI
jgi:hypothetical protein